MIVGYLDHESSGGITVRNLQKQILGRDEVRADLTKDFYGKTMWRRP